MPRAERRRGVRAARALRRVGLVGGFCLAMATGCADDSGKDDVMTSDEWCAAYAERLPPLRDPSPAPDELPALLDRYVERADRLAGGADGLSDEGQAATETVAEWFHELRDGVAAGGDLESLIDDESLFAGPLFDAGAQIDAEAARLCVDS